MNPQSVETLLPCPFCRCRLQEDGDCWHHEMADCPLSDSVFDEQQIGEWNTRLQSIPSPLSVSDEGLVERVARALCRVTRADPDALGVDRQPRWKGWVQFAEAALSIPRSAGSNLSLEGEG